MEDGKLTMPVRSRARLFRWGGSKDRVAIGIVAVIFALLVLPPAVYLIRTSVVPNAQATGLGSFTLHYYSDLLGSSQFLESVKNTVIYAVGSMVFAIAIGTAIAWLLERTNTPLRGVGYFTATIGLGIPQLILALAWSLLLASNSRINQLLGSLFGRSGGIIDVNTMGGMIFVEGLAWSPLAFLFMTTAFRNADAALEEAAAMGGARRMRTFLSVTLPLAKPALYSAVFIILLRSIESFATPLVIGLPGKIHVLTTDIYLALIQSIPADYGTAAATSVILLVAAVIANGIQTRRLKRTKQFATVSGKSYSRKRIDLGLGRVVGAGAIILYFLMMIGLPLAVLLWAAVQRFYVPFTFDAFDSLTWDNLTYVWESDSIRAAFFRTFEVAAIAATVTIVLTVFAGWYTARRRPGSALVSQLGNVPLVFPAIVLGVAMAKLSLSVAPAIYGTIWILIAAYVIRGIPYGMQYSHAGAVQISPELEEGAEVSGARIFGVFRRVVVPLLAPAAIAGWLYVFLTSARDLAIALILTGPHSELLSTVVYSLSVGGGIPALGGIAFMYGAAMVVIATISFLINRRLGVRER